MRILLCHNYYQQPGGEDQVYEDEAWLLRRQGHAVHRYDLHNDSIDGMGRAQLVRNTFWNSQVADEVRDLIRRFRPEVLHCTNTFPLISPAIYHVAAEEGVAVVQSLHNYRLICPKAQLLRGGKVCEACIEKRFAWPAIVHGCYREDRMATAVVAGMLASHRHLQTWSDVVDRYIVPSKIAMQKYVQAGFTPESISVKPNFLQPDPGIGAGPGDQGEAVFVGRLSPEKGIQTLLDAWESMSENIPLTIVGDGPLADSVRRAAASDSRISWLGRRPLDEVCQILGRARCLVMPSIWNETFGRTVIEAFAVGTPAIASRIGAMEELIEEGRTGYFFQTGEAADLARAVRQMFDSEAAANEMRISARQQYTEKYTAETNYGLLMAVYQTAIEKRREKLNHIPHRKKKVSTLTSMSAPQTEPATALAPVNSDDRQGAPAKGWPAKFNLIGVHVSATNYRELTDTILHAARDKQPAVVSCHAVHAVVTTGESPELRQQVNTFQAIAPDGQPVRWALNWLFRTQLKDRVYGPELMLRICEAAAEQKVAVYLYGGTPEVLEKLTAQLTERFPGLRIAGGEAPPFRPLTPEEDREMIQRIEQSGAGVVFIGLGCPKQDQFAYAHREQISAVQVCVGAAFDFHAGVKSMAPAWMQRSGLEWFFRLSQEPARLWKRYLVTNSQFILKLARQGLGTKRSRAMFENHLNINTEQESQS